MKEFWEGTVLPFLQQGYNLYYVIGGAVVLIALIVIICVAASKSKKKKAKKAESVAPASRADYAPINSANGIPSVAVRVPVSPEKVAEGEEKLTKVVEVKPEPIRRKRLPSIEEIEAAERAKAAPAEPTKEELAEKEGAKVEEELKRPGKIVIYKDYGGKYRFRLKACNNATVAHGQGYVALSSCKNGIATVKHLCEDAPIVDLTKDDNGYKVLVGNYAFEVYRDLENKYRFCLRASNMQIVLSSQGYMSKANCLNGIRSARHIVKTSLTEIAE